MKALSLIQPYASAIMIGLKRIETRSWSTKYRGRIAIHASKGMPKWAKDFAAIERAHGRLPTRLPLGAIIGFAEIVDMEHTEQSSLHIGPIEKMYGDYSLGRWSWILDNIQPLPDDQLIVCRGSLGLWTVQESLVEFWRETA